MNPYRQFMGNSLGISHTDINRIKDGRLGAQFWAVYTNCDSLYKDAARIHMEQLDTIKRLIQKYSDDLEFVTNSDGKCEFKNKVAFQFSLLLLSNYYYYYYCIISITTIIALLLLSTKTLSNS